MIADAIEVCVISFLYSISAIPCSSCSILLLMFPLYLFIWRSSFWIFLFFLLSFFLSFPPYFSDYCFVFHCCTSGSKGLFLLLTTWMACSFHLLLQNIFVESRLSSAASAAIIAGMLCYTYLTLLSHEANWMSDTFVDTLWCGVLFGGAGMFLTTINDLALHCKQKF